MADTDWTAAPEWATHLSKDGDGECVWWKESPTSLAGDMTWIRGYLWQAREVANFTRPNDGIMTLERRP